MRLWVAAGSAASLVVVCALAFGWTRTRPTTSTARAGIGIAGVVLGAALGWAFLSGATVRDQGADRRALERRAADLSERALAPGSPLACLDASAGENVEAACEKALFAAPATVAAATSYVAARFALLSDMVAYTGQGGANIDSALLPLRHSLEADRFGFVAHALAVRDSCTSQNCKALDLLHDSSRVRANLSGEKLDRYLEHYLTVWAQPSDAAGAELTPATPAAAQPGVPGQRKVTVNIDFPSAASIPAVSIMNPEPKLPVPPSMAAAAAANPPAVDPKGSKKSRKQAGKQPAQPVAPVAPSADAAAEPVEPVWTPAPAANASSPAAVAPAAAPPVAAAGPVQLTPPQAPPGASAGTPMRTQ